MELQQILEQHSNLPVWCLSRANLRLVQAALNTDSGQQRVEWDQRYYLGNLAGLFELLNVRYMLESRQVSPGAAISLNQLLRCWLRSSPREATIGALVECLGLLQRSDILERLDTRQFLEYYHVCIGYHQRDAGMAAELARRLAQLQPSWRLLQVCQSSPGAAMSPADVSQRCFSSLLLVSRAYLTDCADHWRLLVEEKRVNNYPAFCITAEPSAVQQLPRAMRLFLPVPWSQLANARFFDQLRQCVKQRERDVCQGHMLQL